MFKQINVGFMFDSNSLCSRDGEIKMGIYKSSLASKLQTDTHTNTHTHTHIHPICRFCNPDLHNFGGILLAGVITLAASKITWLNRVLSLYLSGD